MKNTLKIKSLGSFSFFFFFFYNCSEENLSNNLINENRILDIQNELSVSLKIDDNINQKNAVSFENINELKDFIKSIRK